MNADGKLVFTDSTGADTVIPFNNSKSGTFSLSSYNEEITVETGFRPSLVMVVYQHSTLGLKIYAFKLSVNDKNVGLSDEGIAAFDRTFITLKDTGFTFSQTFTTSPTPNNFKWYAMK